eukprot:s6413_g2.t1
MSVVFLFNRCAAPDLLAAFICNIRVALSESSKGMQRVQTSDELCTGVRLCDWLDLTCDLTCTGFLAEDDSETALWLLVVLVILLILALVLLLLLCWRLRSKHQATKEQLAHCQEMGGGFDATVGQELLQSARLVRMNFSHDLKHQSRSKEHGRIWCWDRIIR